MWNLKKTKPNEEFFYSFINALENTNKYYNKILFFYTYINHHNIQLLGILIYLYNYTFLLTILYISIKND